MTLLSEIKHTLLSENVVKMLSNNDVVNILDFLQEDTEHLIVITKLSYKEVITLRRFIIEKYKSPLISGADYYKNSKIFSSYIATGIERLDSILEGGLPIGKLIEIRGLPGSGKTQLAFTILSNITSVLQYNAIYIDTKDDFSATRIHQILKENGHNEKVISICLEQIKVIKIWDMNELIHLLSVLRDNEKLCKCVRVIVLDSLPCLILQYKGEKSNDYLGLLNQFVNIVRFLGNEYKISFIVINILTRWSELSMIEATDESLLPTWIEKKTPTLGKYWQHIPSLYLNLEIKSEDSIKKIDIEIRRTYNDNCSNSICLNLNSKGIF